MRRFQEGCLDCGIHCRKLGAERRRNLKFILQRKQVSLQSILNGPPSHSREQHELVLVKVEFLECEKYVAAARIAIQTISCNRKIHGTYVRPRRSDAHQQSLEILGRQVLLVRLSFGLHLLSPLGLGFHVCVVRIAVGCEVVLFAVCFGLRGVEGRCEHLKVRRGRDASRGKDAFEHDGVA